MVMMFEEAYKQQPANEELGAQTFFANVRASNWKSAQQVKRFTSFHVLDVYSVRLYRMAEIPRCFAKTEGASQVATRMYKQFQEDRYLYWSVLCTVLQVRSALVCFRHPLISAHKAKEVGTPANMRALLYKLAHRIITSSPTPSYLNADRFHLHISILRELELYDDAHKLLSSDVGMNICATNLSCNEIRRDIWRLRGMTKHEGELARQRIVEKKSEFTMRT